MVYAQDLRGFLAEALIFFMAAGCLRRCRSRADSRVAYCNTESAEKDSSVHADGVYDYDEECLRRKKEGYSHVTSLFA